MIRLDIFSLYIFVLSILYIANQIFGVVKSIMSEDPKTIRYEKWEKVSNYLFFSYFLTYIILKTF